MDEETIVAVFDTVAHAELAVGDLVEAGIPQSAIARHTGGTVSATLAEPVREEGFWSRLFGGAPDHDTTVYSRSVENGASVVTVKVGDAHVDRVIAILESHDPIDIDERAARYADDESRGAGSDRALMSDAGDIGSIGSTHMTATEQTFAAIGGLGATADDQTIRLAEERLAVGKRLINRGGTRIRRFVVETPVEEQVSLREERVTLERRPVVAGQPVTSADFTEKTIEMTESAEEAVVSKSAYVTEEIRLRKETTDRIETIRDTVRKEDVEIEQIPAGAAGLHGTKI